MAVVVSVVLAFGVWLIYDGLTRPQSSPVPDRTRRLRELLVQAGLESTSPRDFVILSVLAGLASAVFAHLFLGWLVLSLAAFGAGVMLPYLYFVHRRDARQAEVQLALTDAVEQLRDAIRTGVSVQEGLAALARTGPEPLRGEFGRLTRDIQMEGLEAALDRVRARLADPLFDLVAESLSLSYRVGGRNVSLVLEQLARTARAQLRVREELRAYQSRIVYQARIISALPLLLLVALRKLNPEYVAVFNGPGQIWLVGCAVWLGIGYWAMLRMGSIPRGRRIAE